MKIIYFKYNSNSEKIYNRLTMHTFQSTTKKVNNLAISCKRCPLLFQSNPTIYLHNESDRAHHAYIYKQKQVRNANTNEISLNFWLSSSPKVLTLQLQHYNPIRCIAYVNLYSGSMEYFK